MSAYIVGKHHVAYLAAMAMATVKRDAGMSWSWGRGGLVDLPSGDVATAAYAANMLWEENKASVQHRYGDPVEELPGARFVEDGVTREDIEAAAKLPFKPIQVLKSCNCYGYQSCEHPGWEASQACAFIRKLKDKAVYALDGYGGAKWGAPGEEEAAHEPG